jgi:hypothetical protein
VSYPRRLAERFAEALDEAQEKGPSEFRLLWEEAARLAGIPGDEVRVISKSSVTYLVGQEWVAFPKSDGWHVREWQGEDDAYYEEAIEMAALDDEAL